MTKLNRTLAVAAFALFAGPALAAPLRGHPLRRAPAEGLVLPGAGAASPRT